MKCAWNELIQILPNQFRNEVDKLGRDSLQELRLRVGLPPEMIMKSGNIVLKHTVCPENLAYCINAASRYSPWAASTVGKGYLTSAGGHRIGVCGEAVIKNGQMEGVRNVTSLCIRIARDFPDISGNLAFENGSMLIIGPPGSGKTTLLRDLIRCRSENGPGSVSVVDERGELFPDKKLFYPGRRTDVMTGCTKAQGIDAVLRSMGPACIAVDEITAEEDCMALQQAVWCGVTLYATAHASGVQDLRSRPIYRGLMESKLFQNIVVLRSDKSWQMERMRV